MASSVRKSPLSEIPVREASADRSSTLPAPSALSVATPRRVSEYASSAGRLSRPPPSAPTGSRPPPQSRRQAHGHAIRRNGAAGGVCQAGKRAAAAGDGDGAVGDGGELVDREDAVAAGDGQVGEGEGRQVRGVDRAACGRLDDGVTDPARGGVDVPAVAVLQRGEQGQFDPAAGPGGADHVPPADAVAVGGVGDPGEAGQIDKAAAGRPDLDGVERAEVAVERDPRQGGQRGQVQHAARPVGPQRRHAAPRQRVCLQRRQAQPPPTQRRQARPVDGRCPLSLERYPRPPSRQRHPGPQRQSTAHQRIPLRHFKRIAADDQVSRAIHALHHGRPARVQHLHVRPITASSLAPGSVSASSSSRRSS